VSTFALRDAACSKCATPFQIEIAYGLHITRLPDIRKRLLDGTFQVHTCEKCGHKVLFESTVVFTDFERGEYVAAETPRSATWQTAIARHQTIFRDAFEHGPAIAHAQGVRMKRRLVFGFPALREKLVLWDAGLDDRVVEAVKGDLLRDEEMESSETVLRIATVLEGGHLMFAAFEPMRPPEDLPPDAPWQVPMRAPFDFFTAPAEMVQARVASPSSISRDYPWIADEWFVDLHDGPTYVYQ
jgi:hypothetical protein